MDNQDRIAAFMAYPNAKVLHKNAELEIVAVHLVSNKLLLCNPSLNIFGDFKPDECQLLLTDLEQITDDDAIELAKIIECVQCISDPSELKSHILYVLNNGNRMDGYKLSRAVDFFRSKGYNIPFRGYDLVKEGIAILTT